MATLLEWRWPHRQRDTEPELTDVFSDPVGQRLNRSAKMADPDLEECPNCGELYDVSLGYCPTCTPSSRAHRFTPTKLTNEPELPDATEVKRIVGNMKKRRMEPYRPKAPAKPAAAAPDPNLKRRSAFKAADLHGMESADEIVNNLLEYGRTTN